MIRAIPLVLGSVVAGTSPVFASSIAVPEPSALSLYAFAAAGVVVGARFLRRK